MFPMRIKINPPRNNELRCCFCLHVRTATILLGIWHLVLHVLALSILAIVMRNHHMLSERNIINDDTESGNLESGNLLPGNLLPTPLSKIKNEDNPYYLPTTQDGHAIYSSDMDMGALMTICTLAITLLMVYGTVKGSAIHLLPFFCLQLFDFAITTLTATGYFCYLRSVHQFVREHWHNLPYRKELLQLSPQYLSLLVLVAFLISMLWKAYWISIVWRCYKYLSLRQQNARSTVHYILRGDDAERIPDPDYLLPDYEAACASFKQPPPPSYQAAMETQPPAYPDTIHVVNLAQGEDMRRFGFIVSNSSSTNENVDDGNAASNNNVTVENANCGDSSQVENNNSKVTNPEIVENVSTPETSNAHKNDDKAPEETTDKNKTEVAKSSENIEGASPKEHD